MGAPSLVGLRNGRQGALQIVDLDKLVKGDPQAADSFPPTVEKLLYPQVGRLGMSVPESPGRLCSRRGRLGPHSSNESFTPICYRRLVYIVERAGTGRHALELTEPARAIVNSPVKAD